MRMLDISGFREFLEACGRRISRLDVECSHNTIVSTEDLVAIATHCTQLESISFSSLHMVPEVDFRISYSPVPLDPADFPFLRKIKLSNVVIEDYGKDIFRSVFSPLIGPAPTMLGSHWSRVLPAVLGHKEPARASKNP